MSYLKNYLANRSECERVVLSRLLCAEYTVVSSICKKKVLNILSYLKNYWANRLECLRVVHSRLRCVDSIDNYSICKNKVLNILSYLKNYWVNRPECQRVVLSRLRFVDYTVVTSICKDKVLNILSHLKNYWVNALCSAGCAASTTLLFLQFARIRFSTFCHISETIGPIDWVSTRCAQQVALRRIHCCFFNLQK